MCVNDTTPSFSQQWCPEHTLQADHRDGRPEAAECGAAHASASVHQLQGEPRVGDTTDQGAQSWCPEGVMEDVQLLEVVIFAGVWYLCVQISWVNF